jgi:hypothetical protein
VVGGGGAGRPRAHDDHIGGVLGEGLGHDGHGGISPSSESCVPTGTGHGQSMQQHSSPG